jgi:RNA polymerase sigma factor (sigma-70 family)
MNEAMLQPDLDVLYARMSPRLAALVGRNLTAPPELIEEACQTAWGRLSARSGELNQAAVFPWLATTALRETLRLLRCRSREVSLDDPAHLGQLIELPARAPGPERIAELREQLAEVRALPVRQRQMLWLQGLGYEYEEIATRTGDTRRTVERQLLRARRRLADGETDSRRAR